MAYALGEESFIDANGNNSYDSGETFYDLGDIYIDANENGQWDPGETYVALRFGNFGMPDPTRSNSPAELITRMYPPSKIRVVVNGMQTLPVAR